MQFLKGLILNIGVDCDIVTLQDFVTFADGSTALKKAIEIEKNNQALDAITELFTSMNCVFDVVEVERRFLDGRTIPFYRLSDFRRL